MNHLWVLLLGLSVLLVAEQKMDKKNQKRDIVKILQKAKRSDIPIVLQSLSHPNQNVRFQAIHALGVLKVHKASDRLVKFLKDPSWQIRSISVWAIGQMQQKNVFFHIQRVFSDPHWKVRLAAYSVCSELLREKSPTYLIAGLADSSKKVREKVIYLLNSHGIYAVPFLLKALKSSKDVYKIGALKTLGLAKKPENIPYFLEGLKDPSLKVKEAASHALFQMGDHAKSLINRFLEKGDPEICEILLKHMNKKAVYKAYGSLNRLLRSTKTTKIRKKIIENFVKFRIHEAVPTIILMLSDPNEEVRSMGIWALGEFRWNPARAVMIKSLNDLSWKVRCSSINALSSLKKDDALCHAIEKMLNDKKWRVRYTAAKALGNLSCGTKALLERLQKKEHNPIVLKAIYKTLGFLGSLESVDYLIAELTNPNKIIVSEAEYTLTQIGKRALKKFLKIVANKKKKEELRYRVILLLGKIKAKEVIPILKKFVEDTKEVDRIRYISCILLSDFEQKEIIRSFISLLEDSSPLLQKAIALAMGKLKIKESIPHLIELFDNKNMGVRDAAVWAVSQMPKASEVYLVNALKNGKSSLYYQSVRIMGHTSMLNTIDVLLELKKNNSRDSALQKIIRWALQQMYKNLPQRSTYKTKVAKALEENNYENRSSGS